MAVIYVGSKNPTKIQAVKNVLLGSELFAGAEVEGVNVNVKEFGHPKTIEETIAGAISRAEAVFKGSAVSVGLESGLIVAPGTKTGYLDTTACVLYDGKQFATGLSPSFEWPPEMLRMILGGMDASQAFKAMRLTEHEKIGTAEGSMYVLSRGKINRTIQNEQAILMALIQFQNPAIY